MLASKRSLSKDVHRVREKCFGVLKPFKQVRLNERNK